MNPIAKQIGILLLAGAFLAGVANVVHPRRIPWVQDWSNQVEKQAAEKGVRAMSFAQALDAFEAGQSRFVDARSTAEFAAGHIPGAVSLPFQESTDRPEQLFALLDSVHPLIVYCSSRTCDDALLLSVELASMGATNLTLFVDGFDAWAAAGGEVER